MKVKLQKIEDFIRTVLSIKQRESAIEYTKLGYAINRVSQRADKIIKEINKELQELYTSLVQDKLIDLALTNEDGSIKYDDKKQFVFDKEGIKKIEEYKAEYRKQEETLLNKYREEEYEIEPMIVTQDIYSYNLKPEEAESLKSFVLPEDTDITQYEKPIIK